MSDHMRWRYGDLNPVVAAVESETVIEIGDLVYQNIDRARPASACEGSSNEFKEQFLGVAMQRSREGDTSPIRVATTGVFEFDCAPGDYELGDLVAAAANQAVVKARDRSVAIARVGRRGQGITSVLVDIRSTVMTGGV